MDDEQRMNYEQFLDMLKELERTSLKDLYDFMPKKALEVLKEYRDEKGLSGDNLAVMLSSRLAAEAARKAVIITLAKVYNLQPDPFDPRNEFRIV